MSSSSSALKARLNRTPTLVVPDAYDALTAQLIERAGFESVQCSGYSMSAVAGYVSESNLSYSEALETTRQIVNAVRVPVMADGEDGFGNPDKLRQAMREFIAIGAAGINLEDQRHDNWDARRAVVSQEEMVEKLAIAQHIRATSRNPDFIINARTDALACAEDRAAGLKEAVARANRYLAVGADLTFVTGVRTMDEARHLKQAINGPLSLSAGVPYNIRTLPLEELVWLGLARVSLPSVLISVSVAAMSDALTGIATFGRFDEALRNTMESGVGVLKDLITKPT